MLLYLFLEPGHPLLSVVIVSTSRDGRRQHLQCGSYLEPDTSHVSLAWGYPTT